MGALSLGAAIFLHFQIAVELLNFGAFAGFILVNLSVIRYFFFRLGERNGVSFLKNLIAPGLGVMACSYLWLSLSQKAKIAGFVWLAIGALYLAVITKGFRTAPRSLTALKTAV